jgi:hypothetical protein
MYGTGPGRKDPFEPVKNTAVPVLRYGEQPYGELLASGKSEFN